MEPYRPTSPAPLFRSKCTGIGPAFKRSVTASASRSAGWLSRSQLAVPSVGCPANGNSSLVVKMRTRTPSVRSRAGSSDGSTKVVSERLVSRARACMSPPVSPRPS